MKPKINVQDQFLNQARREHVQVRIDLADGQKLEGQIRSFDNYCVILETDMYHLVYKHAITNVCTPRGGKMAVVVGEHKEADDTQQRPREYHK